MATEATTPVVETPTGTSTTPPVVETTPTTEPTTATTSEPLGLDAKLPDEHPLVKTLAKQKTDLATQKTELAEARAQAAKVTQLETELAARPTSEALETLQTRYDRLEEFLQAAGGALGKALDSRTFTRDLFETDKSVADLAKDYLRANPTATSAALGSAAASPAGSKPTPSELLRAAMK